MMAAVALALVAPMGASAQQQQGDKQAASRRELQQQMRELERQMRELQREMARLEPEAPRAMTRSRVEPRAPLVQVWGNRGYLGVNVRWDKNPATDSIGAVLATVSSGGGAEKAGLQGGDILTTFNGEKLAGRYPAAGEGESEPGRKLVDLAQDLEDGDTVVVDYRRGKETHRATIVARRLGYEGFSFAFPSPDIRITPPDVHVEMAPMIAGLEGLRAFAWSSGWLDMELVKLNPELGEYFGSTDGLLVIRAPEDSELQLKGGDVILSVDGRPATSQVQLMRVLRSYEPGEDVKLDVLRQKRRMTLTVKIPERRARENGFKYDFDWER
jgi:S1-C subfamily serine protease